MRFICLFLVVLLRFCGVGRGEENCLKRKRNFIYAKTRRHRMYISTREGGGGRGHISFFFIFLYIGTSYEFMNTKNPEPSVQESSRGATEELYGGDLDIRSILQKREGAVGYRSVQKTRYNRPLFFKKKKLTKPNVHQLVPQEMKNHVWMHAAPPHLPRVGAYRPLEVFFISQARALAGVVKKKNIAWPVRGDFANLQLTAGGALAVYIAGTSHSLGASRFRFTTPEISASWMHRSIRFTRV